MSDTRVPGRNDESEPKVPHRRYSQLQGSPFAVAPSSLRERYWFSDGAWLDQGQTATVVGVAWTHWLADRGLQAPGTQFDEAFARELYFDSQRAVGQPADENTGTQAAAGAWVLQARGLIERCYTCRDVDTISAALLERGPLVAGISWYSSFWQPRAIDGRLVCRLDDGASVAGGHALLLNGVSLDLKLGGTTGFVRFKNSWGRGWGDAGQCLMSLDDLSQVISGSEVFLPIPTKRFLGPAGRQDVAIPETSDPTSEQSVPEFIRYKQESIRSDAWTTEDVVGYVGYANAIARGIQHPETRPPLTIGIKAPWGAGKTSLMRMIQDRLEWPEGDLAARKSGERRHICLTPASAAKVGSFLPVSWLGGRRPAEARGDGGPKLPEVTNGTLLRAARTAEPETDDIAEPTSGLKAEPHKPAYEGSAASDKQDPWRPTVWFNPWLYQTTEQVWAGMAQEMISQTTARMTRAEREHFWLRLNLRRVDEQAVRRKIYGIILGRALPLAITGLALLVVGVALLASDTLRGLGVGLTVGSPVVLAIVTGLQAVRVLRTPASGSLGKLAKSATALPGFAGQQLGGAFDELVRSPDYRTDAGHFSLIQNDLQGVLDLIATPDRPLVVFVDDLDRCSPSTVVQVIEAINSFLAGQFANAIFVIAMEPQMVAAHIEAAFADLVAKLKETSDTGEIDLGWKFLEKFVQLPLTLPVLVPNQTTAFFGSLFPPAAHPPAPAQPATDSDTSVKDAAPGDDQADNADTADKADNPDNAPLVGAIQAGVDAGELRRIVDAALTGDNPEVRAVIAYGTRFLEPNPRQIKRFVNLFRFFVMIHTERRLQQLPTPASLQALAKLAVLGTRWPALLGKLAELSSVDPKTTVLELLERPAATTPRRSESRDAAELRTLREALGPLGFAPAVVEQLLSSELRGFLRSEPAVGAEVEGYL